MENQTITFSLPDGDDLVLGEAEMRVLIIALETANNAPELLDRLRSLYAETFGQK